jgi:hypothetical protein
MISPAFQHIHIIIQASSRRARLPSCPSSPLSIPDTPALSPHLCALYSVFPSIIVPEYRHAEPTAAQTQLRFCKIMPPRPQPQHADGWCELSDDEDELRVDDVSSSSWGTYVHRGCLLQALGVFRTCRRCPCNNIDRHHYEVSSPAPSSRRRRLGTNNESDWQRLTSAAAESCTASLRFSDLPLLPTAKLPRPLSRSAAPSY